MALKWLSLGFRLYPCGLRPPVHYSLVAPYIQQGIDFQSMSITQGQAPSAAQTGTLCADHGHWAHSCVSRRPGLYYEVQ